VSRTEAVSPPRQRFPGRARAAWFLPLVLGLSLASSAQAFQWPSRVAKPEAPKWGYVGELDPDHWGDLSAEFATCKEGKAQSPIDIRYGQRMDYAPLSFQYRSDSLAVTNDGQGMRVDAGPGSFLIANGHEYALQQYHFHTPSEHRILGARADMELQLVHRDGQGKVAVVAVLMNAGRRINSTLKRIAEALPQSPGQTFYGRQVATNPLFLLPPERSYFSYPGSLTTPPCGEGVDWFVMAEPVEVDADLIARFRQAMAVNARPVQPDNSRPVLRFSRH
jgi:carbonic anhydrase